MHHRCRRRPCPHLQLRTAPRWLTNAAIERPPSALARLGSKLANESALPWHLHRPRMVTPADEAHRVVRAHTVKDCQARECCPSSSPPPAAGDLHSLGRGTTPRLAQRLTSCRVICWQPEVRPSQPPRRPRHRSWIKTNQIESELGQLAVRLAEAQATPSHPSTAWQPEHAVGVAIPLAGHLSDATRVDQEHVVLRCCGARLDRHRGRAT